MSLTSLKTVVLNCIVTAVISAYIKKTPAKLVNFCAAMVILKMEEDSNIFSALYFILSRKVKMQPKLTFVQGMEKVL